MGVYVCVYSMRVYMCVYVPCGCTCVCMFHVGVHVSIFHVDVYVCLYVPCGCMCLFVYSMWVHMGVQVFIHTCAQRSQRTPWVSLLKSYLSFFMFVCLRQSLGGQCLVLTGLSMLACQSALQSHLCIPRAGIRSGLHFLRFFSWVLGMKSGLCAHIASTLLSELSP